RRPPEARGPTPTARRSAFLRGFSGCLRLDERKRANHTPPRFAPDDRRGAGMQSGSHRRYRTALVLIALALGLSAPALAQNVERGHELFDLCARCHGPQGPGHELCLAPNIAVLPLWYIEAQLTKFREGGRGTNF